MCPASTDDFPFASDVISLEPTKTLKLANPAFAGRVGVPQAAVFSLEDASEGSLAGETETLRRRRLLAASVCIALTYAVIAIWVFASANPATLTADGSRYSLRVGLLVFRCLLATVVAGILASKMRLNHGALRAIEDVLFFGLVLSLMVGDYFVGLDLMRRGPSYALMTVAFLKDGVIQILVLMMIYGTLIPNTPGESARVLVAMFIGPIAATLLLMAHRDVASTVEHLAKAEEGGSNVLLLLIGMVLSIYASFVLNGLRTQLHRARKFGQYQLIKKIGEGGMGEVYLAVHQLLKRPCALKLIKNQAGADPVILARFEREVQSAARLGHPNTIEIYDYGHTDDGTFYYVMEYLEGMSLAEMVRDTGPLPPGRLVYLFRQVCAGLAEAHALGLVHRDLKPGNLFVAVKGGESDVAKVLDFGLVKVTNDPGATQLSSNMTISGTPLFMAPEQARGDSTLDARADIYALGAMMYNALTGRPPFLADTGFQVMVAHARDPVVPPTDIRPDIPRDLEAVVLRCLEKRREDRYPNVKALGEALAACATASSWGANRADAWWASRALSHR
jgi:serine/threonine-protein kinase